MENSLIPSFFLLQLSIPLLGIQAFSFMDWTIPISSLSGRSNISPLFRSEGSIHYPAGFNVPQITSQESKFPVLDSSIFAGLSGYNGFGGYGWPGYSGYGGYGRYGGYSGLSGYRSSDSSTFDMRQRVSNRFSKTESKWKTLNNTKSFSTYWKVG